MSVQSFLESAKILYDNEKYNEALCLICTAVGACASREYPNKKDNESYKLFLKHNFSVICKYGFPGIEASSIRIKVNTYNSNLKPDKNGYVNMEQIIYHVIRCGLVHKCDIDKTIKFTDSTIIGDWGREFKIPKDIIKGLMIAVENSMEKINNK